MTIILKQKHSLHGKNLLPIALRLRTMDHVEPRELARLKKEHPLTNYTQEELESEFQCLTGELAKDVLSLAGRESCLEDMRLLMHISICYANDVGAPKSTPLREVTSPNSLCSTQGATSPSGTMGSASDEGKGAENMENRLKAMEASIHEFKEGKSTTEVNDALKQISALASRPKLTSASVLLAAVENLVDLALRASHKDAEFYSKALQACRRFEGSADLCGLCQKLFGSAEDKRISSAVAEWSKVKKYDNGDKHEKSEGDKALHTQFSNLSSNSLPVYPGAHNAFHPYLPFWPMHSGWGAPGGHPYPRPPRLGSRNQGLCHYCKRPGHFVAKCPKLQKDK